MRLAKISFIVLGSLLACCMLVGPAVSDGATWAELNQPPRGLDDPANPYAGQYSELDRWAYQHRLDSSYQGWDSAPADAGAELERLELEIGITAEGWVVPCSVACARWPAAVREHLAQRQAMTVAELFAAVFQDYKTKHVDIVEPARATAARTLRCEGRAAPPLAAEYAALRARAMAELLPPIPAWLGARPPQETIFLPEEQVLCHGALGQSYAEVEQPWLYARPVDPWYRYSLAGKLLEAAPVVAAAPPAILQPSGNAVKPWRRPIPGEPGQGGWWFDGELPREGESGVWWTDLAQPNYGPRYVFPGNFGIVFQSRAAFVKCYIDECWVVGPAPRLIAAYDWDGTRLQLGQQVPPRRSGLFWQVDAQQLAELYRFQLELGLTTPGSTSPYAGTALGPVVVTAAEPTALERGSVDRPKPRALDDLANPYRDEYTQWDRWAFERIAAAPAEELYEDMDGQPYGAPGFFAQTAQTYAVSIELDAAGFPLPLARSWLERAQPALSRDVRQGKWLRFSPYPDYGTDAGPATVTAYERKSRSGDFERARQRAVGSLYPPVPAGLLGKPVQSIVALPDRTFCLLGKPGDCDPAGSYGFGQLRGERVWHRCDQTGRLLARTAVPLRTGGHGASRATAPAWLELTFPCLAAVKAQAAAKGHWVESANGYTLVWNNPLTQTRPLAALVEAGIAVDPREADIEFELRLPNYLIAAYDWDGTPLPTDRPLARPDGYCLEMPWAQVVAGQLPGEGSPAPQLTPLLCAVGPTGFQHAVDALPGAR